ncbi:SRPBCC family protein [Ideonella sp. BN130291]|uniref:SRPBCC family protein n=1 Tax=Ideonella sp. BN130291 TaxID=3112940 RepID=UPI002E2529D1|nr:SRPBCC family protein [Ideonella sp. BN130291]
MPLHTDASHTITIEAPIERCFMFFTPAGEELWVDGWQPQYLWPSDGRTEAGMVFTTGQGEEHTIWMLVDFDRRAHRSRYARVTPGSRTGLVEVRCRALDAERTEVSVSYMLTALSAAGATALQAFEGEAFARMIDGWAVQIAARRDALLAAHIR